MATWLAARAPRGSDHRGRHSALGFEAGNWLSSLWSCLTWTEAVSCRQAPQLAAESRSPGFAQAPRSRLSHQRMNCRILL